MVQNQARVGDMGVEELILSATVIKIAVVDLTVLVDMIVQREFCLGKGLPINNDVIRFKSHRTAHADYNKVDDGRK